MASLQNWSSTYQPVWPFKNVSQIRWIFFWNPSNGSPSHSEQKLETLQRLIKPYMIWPCYLSLSHYLLCLSSLLCSNHTGHLPWICQICCSLRTFALAISSVLKYLPWGHTLSHSLPSIRSLFKQQLQIPRCDYSLHPSACLILLHIFHHNTYYLLICYLIYKLVMVNLFPLHQRKCKIHGSKYFACFVHCSILQWCLQHCGCLVFLFIEI